MTVTLITGVAPHSLGECIVSLFAQDSHSKLICIDIEANSWLQSRFRYHSLRHDLNPLQHSGGIKQFSSALEAHLYEALNTLQATHISRVIQCAGVYWSGRLADSTSDIRQSVFGVNLIGRIELLNAVLRVNAERGADNGSSLVHVDVGSFQGLKIRQGRALYAASKSSGIDFAAALVAGNELRRSIYFAPGPIDTYMLHYNHWVVKSRGSQQLLKDLKSGDRDLYRAIFVDCLDDRLRRFISDQDLRVEAMDQFQIYKRHRREAAEGEFGILQPDECAQKVLSFVNSPEVFQSGVYTALRRDGKDTTYDFREFAQLSRYDAFSPNSIQD